MRLPTMSMCVVVFAVLLIVLPSCSHARRKSAGAKARQNHHGREKVSRSSTRTAGLPMPSLEDPAAAQALYETGMSELSKGKFERALGIFEELASAGYRDVGALGKGIVFSNSGRLDEAVAAFGSPDLVGTAQHQMALVYRGKALRGMDMFGQAVESLTEALALTQHSQHAVVTDAHVELCQVRGEHAKFYLLDSGAKAVRPGCNGQLCPQESVDLGEQAIEVCQAAAAISPDDSTRMLMHEKIADMMIHLNRRAEAVDELAIAFALYPEHVPLLERIDQLRTAASRQGDQTVLVSMAAPGVLHKLWPSDEGGGGVEDVQDGPATFPFKLVSTVTGSSPSIRPWLTPVFLVEDQTDVTSNLNRELSQIIKTIVSDSTSAQKSNIGGFQSREPQRFLQETVKLPGGAGAAARALQLHILEQVSEFANALGIISTVAVSIRESWININTQGAWNREHCHGHAVTLAGCYYVDSGVRLEESNQSKLTGLRIRDPRPDLETGVSEAGMYLPPRADLTNLSTSVFGWPQPQTNEVTDDEWSHASLGQPGTLVLWPGYLNHWVPQHKGSGERISIAFNVYLTLER